MIPRRSFLTRARNAIAALSVPACMLDVKRGAHADERPHERTRSEGFATMPFDNAPFGAPPLTFGNRSGITLIVTTKPELVRALLPPPLDPLGSELMIQQHLNTIVAPMKFDYPNATVIVPARLNGTEGFYMSRVYEGSSQATVLSIWGREIWGFPKIAADTNVSKEGTTVTSYVRALNGKASADVRIDLDPGQTPKTEPAATVLLYCRKTIPSADGRGLDLDRLIEVPWRSTPETRYRAKVAKCDVNVDVGEDSVPIPVVEHVDTFWFTQDAGTILDRGKVVHDYLSA